MLPGELYQQVVIRDPRGTPVRVSAYVQGQTVFQATVPDCSVNNCHYYPTKLSVSMLYF
jgi:hypothetical protein